MKSFVFGILVIFLAVTGVLAQPAEGNPGGTPAPVDGGIGLLIAAGAAFGGKKAYDRYCRKDEV